MVFILIYTIVKTPGGATRRGQAAPLSGGGLGASSASGDYISAPLALEQI